MTYPIQYTRKQRERVYNLFFEGREKGLKNVKGKYTGKEISAMTGVSLKMVYKIAHGER